MCYYVSVTFSFYNFVLLRIQTVRGAVGNDGPYRNPIDPQSKKRQLIVSCETINCRFSGRGVKGS